VYSEQVGLCRHWPNSRKTGKAPWSGEMVF